MKKTPSLDALIGVTAAVVLEQREAYERAYVVIHGAPSPTAHMVPTVDEVRAQIEKELEKRMEACANAI